MSRRRPPLYATRDTAIGVVDDALTVPGQTVDPQLADELRTHSVGTRAELRKTMGSRDGLSGPRACMLAGYTSALDAGVGVFVWDETSTTPDDEGASTLQVAGVTTGRWRRAQLYPTPVPAVGRVVGIQKLTSGTTYTRSAGVTAAIVRGWAGGGGGGGAGNGLGIAIAAGGASGGYWEKYVAAMPATATFAIGAGGTAGANTGGNGGTGGDTTFNDGIATYTAKGGGGGAGDTATTGDTLVLAIGGASPAASTNADINGAGTPGGDGLKLRIAAPGIQTGRSGAGASSSLGGGGDGVGLNAAGNNAKGFGSGGSGATQNGNSGGQIGGTGSQGIIHVVELS